MKVLANNGVPPGFGRTNQIQWAVLAAAGPFAGLAALFPRFGPSWLGRRSSVVEPGIGQSAEEFENLCYGHGHDD